MSKYSSLSRSDGNSKFFLQRTLTEHDKTMDHPWMQMIYAKAFNLKQYGAHLAQMHALFKALEDCSKDLELLRPVLSSELPRTQPLEADMSKILGKDWAREASDVLSRWPGTQKYLENLKADAAKPELVLAHHFLQYNAVLSGGAFLGEKVSQFLGLPHGAPGVAFYAFAGVKSGKESARVQQYLRDFDTIELSDEQRESMLAVMQRVYADLEVMMNEVYDMNPVAGCSYAAAKNESDVPVVHAKPEEMIELALSELHGYVGAGEGQILMSLAGEILDISAGRELYGPEGGYSLLAGHDVTRCLATMSLDPADLDDLRFTPQSPEDEATLQNWREKLKQKYPVIGRLKASSTDGQDQGLRQRAAVAASTGSATGPTPAVSSTATPSGGADAAGGQKCPISGKEGAGCPMAMFMGSKGKAAAPPAASAAAGSTATPATGFMAGKSMLASATEPSQAEQPGSFLWKLCPLHWDDQTMKLLICVASVAWCSGIFVGWNLHKQLMAS